MPGTELRAWCEILHLRLRITPGGEVLLHSLSLPFPAFQKLKFREFSNFSKVTPLIRGVAAIWPYIHLSPTAFLYFGVPRLLPKETHLSRQLATKQHTKQGLNRNQNINRRFGCNRQNSKNFAFIYLCVYLFIYFVIWENLISNKFLNSCYVTMWATLTQSKQGKADAAFKDRRMWRNCQSRFFSV